MKSANGERVGPKADADALQLLRRGTGFEGISHSLLISLDDILGAGATRRHGRDDCREDQAQDEGSR